jgi:hypothetical protein
VAMGMAERTRPAPGAAKRQADFSINADVDWETYIKQFAKVPREELFDALKKVVHQTTTHRASKEAIEKVADKSNRESYIKTVTVALMSTPEYQLS